MYLYILLLFLRRMIQNREKINPKIIPILVEFKHILKNLYGENLKKLILYGSYVHGEERNHSDIDLAINLKNIESPYKEIDKINEVSYELDIKNNIILNFHPISEEKFNSENLSFYNTIKAEGIVV